jgi:uncharacterized protein YndB with AHSA1/START domain
VKRNTTVERKSERELVVTRAFNAPAHIVFEAWTKAALLKRWHRSRLGYPSFPARPMFARGAPTVLCSVTLPQSSLWSSLVGYLEVTPHSRLVWTNDEGGEGGAVTMVTFEERGAETLVVMRDLYPSKEALDGAIASGSTSGFSETFEQLDELLVTLARALGAPI